MKGEIMAIHSNVNITWLGQAPTYEEMQKLIDAARQIDFDFPQYEEDLWRSAGNVSEIESAWRRMGFPAEIHLNDIEDYMEDDIGNNWNLHL